MKKLLSTILASTLILSSLPTTMAQEAVAQDPQLATLSTSLSDFTIEDGVLYNYIGEGGDVVIPDSVTEIWERAFSDCKTLTSVEFPDSVTVIGPYAFWDCTSLTTLEIPDSVTTLSDGAFSNCSGLTTVSLPESITELGYGVFHNCTSLTTVNIPSGLTETNLSLFSGCEALSALTIPDSVTRIGYESFRGCQSLTSLTLPESVTVIEDYAFVGCDGLTTLTLPKSIEDIGAASFDECTALTTVYYNGSEADRENILIDNVNDYLENATWIYNSTGPSVEEPTTPTYSAWAESFVTFSEENGLIVDSLGMDYTKDISRLQIADLLVNMVEKASGETLPLSEESFTDTSSEAVLKAAQAGIIGGRGDGIFDPDNTATREEISIMIVRAIEKLEELSGESYIDHSLTTLEGFSDSGEISSWATDFVGILANNGIMAGSEGKLTPLSPTSIQECLVLNNNLFQLG